MINVVFLWHMHQPYYVDPLTQTALMPWVRLHAVKGYLDMIDVALKYPDLKNNFNFTPVLVKQLEELANHQVSDLWESWARKPADQLSSGEKENLLQNYFKINWSTIIEQNPRYLELLELRGREFNDFSLKESIHHFDETDYRDLQTWFNLAWCGFSAERRYPELSELKKKGRNFTEEEKNRVLDIHNEIIKSLLPLYKEAQDNQHIEITTTPFYHPIMPLVYDTQFADRCMPGRQFPPRFSAPDDVLAQLKLAQEQHQRVFGQTAKGLWPSEGSIAPELIPLFHEAGIEYFCTDEDNLFNSLRQDSSRDSSSIDHLELFQPWCCEFNDSQVYALFRERPLSDFIGFNAARNSAEEAASHLLHHLEHISQVAHNTNPVVCLALDGENAWEAFIDGGENFLNTLYAQISGSSKLQTQRMGDFFSKVKDAPKITTLHTGSWINSDFDIWIGDPEENRGWEWIGKTREFLVQASENKEYNSDQLEKAWQEIYASEGSDWFWWYGPDFQTDNDYLFDRLFRQHLQNVYHCLKEPPPNYLDVPIRQRSTTPPYRLPSAYISPSLSGKPSGFYDWMGAGHFDIRTQQTAMFQSDRIGQEIFFGFNETTLFIKFLYQGKFPDQLIFNFCKPNHCRIKLHYSGNKQLQSTIETSSDGSHFSASNFSSEVVLSDWLELSIPFAALNYQDQGELIAFTCQIFKADVEVERYPERGLIEFDGPSPQFSLKNWFI